MRSATAFANGTFDPKVFRNSEYGRNALDMQKIAVEHKGDPMNPEVLKYWEEKGAKKELYEAGTDTEWSVFTPLNMDKSKNTRSSIAHTAAETTFLSLKPMAILSLWDRCR